MTALILNTIDRFLSVETNDARWQIAQDIVADIGCNAINTASVDRTTGQMEWALLSMSNDWLDAYVGEGYYQVDPLILGARNPTGYQLLKSQTVHRDDSPNRLSYGLNHELAHYGYSHLSCIQMPGQGDASTRLVVFSGDDSTYDFHRKYDRSELGQLARTIAAFVTEPATPDPRLSPIFGKTPLSGRERDVLSLLAAGHRNDEIGYRLSIAEVTVRSHIKSARLKLGAKTREHALVEAIRTRQINP